MILSYSSPEVEVFDIADNNGIFDSSSQLNDYDRSDRDLW